MSDIYGSDTLRMVQAMKNGVYKAQQEGNRYVFYPGKPDEEQPIVIMPSYVTVEQRVYAAQRPGETQKDYADRLGHHPQQFSQYCSIGQPRQMQADSVIQIVMRMPRVPTVADVDHILMELNLPQLRTDTFSQITNQRNLVIRRMLQLAAKQTEQGLGDKDWFATLCAALKYLKLPPIRHGIRNACLSAEDAAWIDTWKPELAILPAIDYTRFRREMLEKYGLSGGENITQICDRLYSKLMHHRLSQDSGLTLEKVRTCFASRMDPQRNRMSRIPLILVFSELGCTFDEINRVLWEADRALLYPKQGDEDERELCFLSTRHS